MALGPVFEKEREKMTIGFKGNRPYSAKQRLPSRLDNKKQKPPKLPALNNIFHGNRTSGFNPMTTTNSILAIQKKSISEMSMMFPGGDS